MSAKWLGLHNPEAHYSPVMIGGESTCRECMENCSKPYPCSCCLAEEVKVLRARLTARDIDGAACEWEDTERLDMAGWYCLTHHCRARAQSRQCPLAVVSAENERLRGRIQAARDVCTASRDLIKWNNTRAAGAYMPAVPINDILAALDGDA